MFRLGLRPPRVSPLKVVRSAPDPLPSPDHQLTVANLNEAWRDGVPNSWSAQRVAVVVLDAHGAAMAPAEVLAFGGTRSQWTLLRAESAQYWRSGADVLARVVSLRWMWTSTASSTAFAAAHPETAPTYNARHRVADSRRFQRVCPESWVISGRSSVGKSVGVGCRVMGAGVVVLRPPDERIRQASLGRHGRDPRPGHEPAGGAGPTAE